MKVALVSSSYHPYYKGGGEYSVKYLAEKLVAQGVEALVITAFHQAKIETINGVKVYRVRHPNIYWSYESDRQPGYKKLTWHAIESYNPRVANRVGEVLRREQPDVLHIRNVEDFSPYVAKVARQHGIPVVVTLNSYTWLCPKATMFKRGSNCATQCLSCRLLTYPKKVLSRHVNAVVGVSQFLVDRHQQYGYFPSAQASVIYTSAEPQPQPLPATENDFITFGYLGRIHPTKGVHQIIEAFQRLPAPHRLLIAGDGPLDYVRQCQRRAAGNERITLLGKYPAGDFYPQVDVMMISSLWNEPFPRVLVEAYAFGRPVVAANTGGTPERVVEGQTGWIYDPLVPDQLRTAIQKVTQMSATALLSMQKNIVALLRERLPDDAEQYVTLYQSLREHSSLSKIIKP